MCLGCGHLRAKVAAIPGTFVFFASLCRKQKTCHKGSRSQWQDLVENVSLGFSNKEPFHDKNTGPGGMDVRFKVGTAIC